MKQIIRKPVISEKSFSAAGSDKFSFIVDPKVDKALVAATVEEMFKVKVIKINILSYQGKIKRTKGRLGQRNSFKKAIVTLKAGQKISLFEAETDNKAKDDKKSLKSETVKKANADKNIKITNDDKTKE